MPTTTRTGNDYRAAIGLETAYKSGYTNSTNVRFADMKVLPDKVEFSYEPQQIDTGAKSGVGLSTICEYKPGYLNYTVTMSGYLSDDHDILLKAFTAATSTPYAVDGIPTLGSYAIFRIWSDAQSPAGTYVVDKAIGCQLKNLTFSGASGGMVMYEAVFAAYSITRETTQAISDYATLPDPGVNCTEGYNFGDITATLNFGVTTALKSFSINLTNETPDDASMYQNSNTLATGIIVSKVVGELNYVTNYYSTATDKAGESKIYDSTPLVEVIKFNNSTADWTLTMNTQVTSYTLADPDKALFENNVTSRLVYTTGVNPISIAVA